MGRPMKKPETKVIADKEIVLDEAYTTGMKDSSIIFLHNVLTISSPPIPFKSPIEKPTFIFLRSCIKKDE